ncbi:MAG: apolipoprotein N-acyltransferase [Actinobacteria bacterium]|nr:apolipoprotein N-acyltransferase [Actinomycetota bacterium]
MLTATSVLTATKTWLGRPGPVPLAAAGGGLLLVSFPPIGWWPLAPVAVAALSVAVHGRRPRQGAGLGLVFGLSYFVPLLSWSGTEVGAVPWLLLATSQAAFVAALGGLLPAVQRLAGGPVWAACLWVADEAARSRLPFGGFPWGRLAFGQGHSWFTPFAAYGGAPLVSLMVALCGTLAAGTVFAARARGRQSRLQLPLRARALAACGAAALAGPLAGSALRAAVPTGVADPQLVVAAVQGNVPRLGLDFNAQREAVLHNHVNETLRLAGQVRAGVVPAPAFVLWPENASDIDPLVAADAREQIGAAATAVGVPILVGAVLDGPGDHLRNAGIVWSPTTGPGQTYLKRHPVPFAEYIPLRSVARLVSHQVDRVRHDFVAGDQPGVLELAGHPIGDVICFEVADDRLVRDVVRGGAQLLVVQTNNATFERSGETHQQLEMSRLRAVEYGRTVVVVATSGVSALIAPDGRIIRQSAIFTPDLLVGSVPTRSGLTLATRLGAVPEWLLSAAGLLAAAVAAAIGRLAGHRRVRDPRGTATPTSAEQEPATRAEETQTA